MNSLNGNKRLKGKIRWFDGFTGDGAVITEDGRSYYLHFTGINGVAKNNYQWPTESDQKFLGKITDCFCTFELDDAQALNVEF